MFDLVIACLADHVFSIRDAACKTLQQIVDIFGLDWAKQIVMPKVFQLAEEKNYLRRMTMLFQINYLMSSELSEKVLFPPFGLLSITISRIKLQNSVVSQCVPSTRTMWQMFGSTWRVPWVK